MSLILKIKNEDSGAMRLIVGIDASRNRSGGAKAHLFGILSSLAPEQHGIAEVHLVRLARCV